MSVLLAPLVALCGDEAAVIDDSSVLSWRTLDERVDALSAALATRGVEADDRIVALLGNQHEMVELSLAALGGGWVLVPLNWHWVAREVAYVIDDATPSAIIVDQRFEAVASEALAIAEHPPALRVLVGAERGDKGSGGEGRDEGWVHYEELLSGAPETGPEPLKGGPMFYTSGTTGFPKGVKSTLSAVGGPAELSLLIAHSMGPTIGVPPLGSAEDPRRCQLICGPMYHSAQWVFAHFALLCGATIMLQHRFDAGEVLELIEQHGVTNLHLVPTQMSRLLDLPAQRRARFDASTLRTVLHGAAPCPPALKRALIEWWGPIVSEYYGGTEGGFLALIESADWLERPGSVGRPLPVVEVRILDDEGNVVEAGHTGEIWFRNLLGSDFEYHNAPGKTDAAHRDGFGTLGDVGYLDADGFLYLADRKIDMVVSGGVNIYPAEVEGALHEHPAISDVAVFGVPHAEMGEAVHAAVVLRDGIEWSDSLEADLDAWCRERLAGYKRPRGYEVHEELPRNESGKLLKRGLRDPWWAGTDRRI